MGEPVVTSPSIAHTLTAEEDFKTSHPPHSHSPTTMATLEEQVALLTQQIQVLQNQLSTRSPSPPVDLPPPPTTTKLPKIATPTLVTGLQDDLDCFKVECSLYICLRGSEFPDKMSWMLFILSSMKGGDARTWAMHKIQQVLNPSGTPMTMDEFEAEVDLMFTDPNQEVTAQQKLSTLWQGANSINKLIQQFEVHGPTSRLGDIGLVHHFEQALNSCLRESIYRLCPIPRTWVEWKHKASILDNQWRQFNATHPQMMTSKNPATSTMTPMHSATPPPSAPPSTCSPMPSAPSSKPAVDLQPMDLDRMKSKNPPRTCYNCNKPGHIAQNCLEPCTHQVCNADPLSLETIQAIAEAIRIAVGGDAMRGEGVTGDIQHTRSKAKELQEF